MAILQLIVEKTPENKHIFKKYMFDTDGLIKYLATQEFKDYENFRCSNYSLGYKSMENNDYILEAYVRCRKKPNAKLRTDGLISKELGWGNWRRIYKFDNGYGASVLRKVGRDGEGNWEIMALIYPKGSKDHIINYGNRITPEPIKWLNNRELNEMLENINCLEPLYDS